MAGLVNMKTLYFAAVVLALYFFIMDIILLHHIQAWSPVPGRQVKPPAMYDPFKPLSVKHIMIDHMTNYVYGPLSEYFNFFSNFSDIFPWITPNMISICHMITSVIAAKLIADDNLSCRQIGALVFEFRTYLDSLDGVVYRAHAKNKQYASNWGTLGYNVDMSADILAGGVLFLALTYRIWRNTPESNYSQIESSAAEQGLATKSSNGASDQKIPRKTLLIYFVLFGLRLLLSAYFWDHYVHKYHNLLEGNDATQKTQALRSDLAHSAPTLIIWWMWRIGNSGAFLEFIIASVVFDKVWEFVRFTHYVGWVFLITLIVASQIHTVEIASAISAVASKAM
ncbi:ceramide phosphoethanolamine synthase isoform X3 [Lingula anatina]|uniref:Ceramide phosphoethanolamine synthase isoform X3 n=1 Tax=Lingula anatina TaxID=7574 RepID=A0A1S3KEZ0_LINAN|nr:ceramide phosphoethanolamine synthase isoform X3 [Lingula anatina]|eukprot:XP_013420806.1 ceramide phosphoethanolamine synthase isoform X3 [Lingula anatina]